MVKICMKNSKSLYLRPHKISEWDHLPKSLKLAQVYFGSLRLGKFIHEKLSTRESLIPMKYYLIKDIARGPWTRREPC